MRWLLVLLSLLFARPILAGDLETLGRWMTGSFSSAAQAEADGDFFDIRLEMAPIWKDRPDGLWLYVEQAAAGSLDRPYRQRVYHVTGNDDGIFRSEVYALPDPLRFAGAWRQDELLAELTPDSLTVRDGCAVVLRREAGDVFAGNTVGDGCSSSLRGAAYATSEVEVGPDRIESWDRGYAADGRQVWGAEKGPYVFLRRTGAEAMYSR